MPINLEAVKEIEGHPLKEEKLELLVSARILQPISATHVSNECVYINPSISIGNLDLKMDADSSLGCQVSLGILKKIPDRLVYGMEQHNRSAIVSSESGVVWNGVTFNYLDAKGTGYLRHVSINIDSVNDPHYLMRMRPEATRVVAGEDKETTTWGGASLDWNSKDVEMSEIFSNLGIRTVPIVALIRLDQIMDEKGNMLSIEEAKSLGMITKADEPGLILRAWVTPFRLKDAIYDPSEKETYGIETSFKDMNRKKNILLAAIEDIKNDASIPIEVRKSFEDPINYVKWLASTIGQQVGLMHKNGYIHGYLSALHNITLDGRIMDLDSVLEGPLEDAQEEITSLVSEDSSEGALHSFYKGMCSLLNLGISPDTLGTLTIEAYTATLNSMEVRTS